jgi:hypothetical protein
VVGGLVTGGEVINGIREGWRLVIVMAWVNEGLLIASHLGTLPLPDVVVAAST